MSIIAVVSGKGGVGKTNVAINIACAFKMLGKKCLLVDCGFGVRNDDVALGRTTQSVCNIKDLILGNADVDEVIILGDEDYMPDFIAASPSEIPDGFFDKFADIFKKIYENYDYIVFDTPAAVGNEFKACTDLADTVVAVTLEDAFSVSNTALCLGRISDEKQKFIVLGRCEFSSDDKSPFAEDIADEIGAPIIGIIREDEFVAKCLLASDPIVRYDTFAGRELENISRRLMGAETIPEKKSRLFERNKLVLKTTKM